MDSNKTSDNGNTMKDASAAAGSVASDLRQAATQKFEETISEVRAQANESKDNVAGEVNSAADALRKASQDLRHGSAQERTMSMIANSLADASGAMQDKDLGEMVQVARNVARENPILFLGGAILLGFAASRYAKATAEPVRSPETQGASSQSKETDRFANEGNPNTQPFGVPT